MKHFSSVLSPWILIPIFFVSLVSRADILVGTAEQAKELLNLNELTQKYATRIEIPYERIRRRFDEMVNKGESFASVSLDPDSKTDRLILNRSGNSLRLYAIVDNIGTRIDIKHDISFVLKRSRNDSGNLVIDRSLNQLAIYVIAGNVGTVISIEQRVTNKVLSDGPTKQATPISAGGIAESGQRYAVQAGTKFQFSNGYQWWNAETKEWEWVTPLPVNVQFHRSGWVYAN